MAIQVVILAAGQGKRMNSRLPKVLHTLAGKPLLRHVIDTALKIAPETKPVIIYGHEGEQVKSHFASDNVTFVEQTEQAGTGHAVQQALPQINASDRVLILYGDVPLISVETLQALLKQTPELGIGIVTAYLKNPEGYGRIKRDSDAEIMGIIEEKDASEKERRITEINSGIYLVSAEHLQPGCRV